MRNFFLALGLTGLLGTTIRAQPLFVFGKNTVGKDEFLRQFSRNLNPKDDRVQAMKEYLPLFINYKLKVQDAYDKHLDTSFNQLTELNDFRHQLEENYFSEEANLNKLVEEAFDRSQKDIHLQDLFIAFDGKNPASADAAELVIQNAYKALKEKTTFGQAVSMFSTDPDLKKANGDLGWITVFSLPYRLETLVYALKPGEYTEPVKTGNGFHIFKKAQERPAAGKVRVAQILCGFPPNATDQDKAAIAHTADSVYTALQSNGDFATMARIYSIDKTSYQNGGVLPEFGVGSYDRSFEEAAFALKDPGEISRPFVTAFGVHILKLSDHLPVPADKTDAAALSILKQRVVSDNRMETAKANLVKSLLPKIGFQASKTLNKNALWKYTDSAFAGAPTAQIKEVNAGTEIFRFTKQSIKVSDWMKFIKAIRGSVSDLNERTYTELFEKYVSVNAAEYYKKHLEDYSADFKNQLKEFKDANLNFEITDKMVWTRASEDNAGLMKHYAANKAKYQWAPSVNAIIVTGTEPSVTAEAQKEMAADISQWRKIATKYENKLLADSNRFEQTQVPVEGKVAFKAGLFTPPISNGQEKDSTQTFCYIVNVLDQTGQRSFEEARGFVINDYQQVLEARWLEALKKKYPVKVNDAAWKEILKK